MIRHSLFRRKRGAVPERFEDNFAEGWRGKFLANEAPLPLSPRRPGGEGRVRGADEAVRGAAHLTLPPLRDGSLPLPPGGGEGLLPQGIGRRGHQPTEILRLSGTAGLATWLRRTALRAGATMNRHEEIEV